jgi:hypothetical protein
MSSSATLLALDSDAFLRSTAFCTADHPVIVQTVKTIVKGANSGRTKAARLFEWVRDHILYTVGNWNQRAWETVLAGEGSCTNKANVLVAMLRSVGIPAAFGVLTVDATKYWGIGVPGWICQGFSKASVHAYVTCFIDGRWLDCDPTDDRALCENVEHLNPLSRLLEFDGTTDAMMPFSPEDVRSDERMLPSLDHLLSKPMKADPAQVEMMNFMVRAGRRMGGAYPDAVSAQAALVELVCNHAPDLFERFCASFRPHTPPPPPPSATRLSTRLRIARASLDV